MQKTQKILIAEDEAINKKLIEKILSKSGYEILTAKDGKEAIEIYLREDIDLIFMDIQMPVMNGLEAIREIRKLSVEKNKQVKIIVLTAYYYENPEQFCQDSQSDDLITKPIEPETLLKKVINLLE